MSEFKNIWRKRVMLVMGYYERQRHMGIAHYARQAGWEVNSWMCHTGQIMRDWKCDGIISLHGGGFHDEIVEFIKEKGVPAVDTSVQCEKYPTPVVRFNDSKIGKIAAEHFVERGFQNIYFVSYENGTIENMRYAAFKEHLNSLNRDCQKIDLTAMQHWHHPPEEYMCKFADIIDELPKPCAIFVENDRKAYEVCVSCHAKGISIPEQVAVLGTDNDEIFALSSPVPFSTIDGDLFASGYQAAKLLDKMMNGIDIPKQTFCVEPKGLIVRQGTDILAIPHKPTATALKFIWNNYYRQIGISDVADAAGISRQHLHKLFKIHLGRSMHDELTAVRLKNVRKLLSTTDMKLESIAFKTGFASGDRLGKVFRKFEGMTPATYRKKVKNTPDDK